MMTVKKVFLFSAVVGWLASGCGASKYMRPVSGPEPVGAPPDKARVVFVRPSNFQLLFVFTIIDERGYFLGDSTGNGRFSVFLDPGEHYFIAWTENTETVKATLAPGRTYYVEVRPTWGMGKGRASLWAVNRRSGLMKKIPSYLADTLVATSDFAAGQAHLNSLGQQLPSAVKKGLRTYNRYSRDEKADATLMPEDGQ
jgi:hypothetical protein